MKKVYELGLCEKDFKELADELKGMKNDLSKAKELILNALADYTQKQVRAYIDLTVGWYDYVPTEELWFSITKSAIFEDTIKVYTDKAYAKYVEYGTGIRGMQSPHPEADEVKWGYDVNGYGEKGQHAHKFMYNAFQDLKNNYMKIAIEALKEEGIV